MATLSGAAAAQVAPTTLPSGAAVTAGQAGVSQSGAALTVTQSTAKAILTWQSFNIGSQASVTFQQPNASAIALNRVLSSDPSSLLGKLSANGQVVLVNPNGVIFGGGSTVNVGGLVASSLDIKDSDFLAGTMTFQRNGATGAVVNQGTLTAAGGGIALLAPSVSNQGLIQVQLGTVALASGDAVTIATAANGAVSVKVDPASVKSQIDQGGAIVAADGRVLLTAKAANALLGGAIGLGGSIEANSLTAKGGEVVLEASGPITVTGRITASGATDGGNVSVVSQAATTISGSIAARGGRGSGGQVETSGGSLAVGGATIDVGGAKPGGWLLDPYDLTVDATSAGTIDAALATGNVTLQTTASGTSGTGIANAAGNGDIIIAAPLSWTASTTLTLNAWRNIAINANVTASGASAGLVMNPGQGVGGGTDITAAGASVTLTGSTPTLSIGGHAYTLLTSVSALQAMGTAGYWALMGTIDASSIASFTPIGYSASSTVNTLNGTNLTGVNATPTAFTGVFDGLGHSIGTLTISNQTANNLGLFSEIGGTGVVRNLTLAGGSLTAGGNVSHAGQLTGWNLGSIANVTASGSVVAGSAGQAIGGLVGANYGTVGNSSDSGTVTAGTGALAVGGLVGASIGGTITGSSASGTVSAGANAYAVGGLVGANDIPAGGSPGAIISGSSAGGAVSGGVGASYVGGLVGENEGAISTAYATGAVSGGSGAADLGGLVGGNNLPAAGSITPSVATSYASGSVTATASGTWMGGLVGWNQGSITNSYANGAVNGGSGAAEAGGLVGGNAGTVGSSWSSGAVSGASGQIIGGLVGVNSGTVTGGYWDTATSGQTTGIGGGTTSGATGLTTSQAMVASSYTGWDFTNIWYLVAGDTRPFLRSEYGTTITNAHQLQLVNLNLSASYTLGGAIAFPSLASSGMWNTQTGFAPIGTAVNGGFTGTFDGLGHTISGLTIVAGSNLSGLFGTVGATGVVRNLGLVGESIGTASFADYVGGLVGYNLGQISSSYVSGTIATGAYNDYVGGLVGANTTLGSIRNSYSTAAVTGGVGNLEIGGLVGLNSGTIATSTASGAVTGGLGSTLLGGLVGSNSGTGISGDYWDITTTKQSVSAGIGATSGATGLTDSQAKLAGSYVGWDFAGTWYSGSAGYPQLQVFRPTLTVTANNASMVYGSATPILSFSYSGFLSGDSASSLTSAPTAILSASGTLSVGTYAVTPAGAVDPTYTIIYAPGVLTVTPKPLSWSIASASTVYGTSISLPTATLSGVLTGDSVTPVTGLLSGSTVIAPATGTAAGTYSETVSGLTGPSAGNYTLASTGNGAGTLTIAQAPLTVTAGSASRYYGATTPATSLSYSGFVAGDTAARLTTAPSLRTTALAASLPGVYPIVPYGAVDGNYAITYVPGLLSVLNPVTGLARPLVVAATTESVSAGSLLSAFSALPGPSVNAIADHSPVPADETAP